MSSISTKALPRHLEDITKEWLTEILSDRYPGTAVTELHLGTVIAGTATKVRLLLSYNDAGHRHRLPPTMWLKGGFIRHGFTFDEAFVQEAKFFTSWGREMDINIPRAFWAGWEEGTQGLVLMEDLAARNAIFTTASSGLISVDQQMQTLNTLAVMHARWWESPELDRRTHEKDLLAAYLEALRQNGVAKPPLREEAWEAYRRHAMHGFMWAFTPTEMQPLDIVTAEGDLFGTAVVDLDRFGALGV